MNKIKMDTFDKSSSKGLKYKQDAFIRPDEGDDSIFYARDRFVSHLDSLALATVESLIGDLVIEEKPVILDLMAGWDSHIPEDMTPEKVIGLGLNRNELEKNRSLSEIVIHDINTCPELPFPENTFDAVINTVSIDYMAKPFALFRQVARVLKPGGLFLVIFSNRMFPHKAVKVWQESDEEERIILVEEFFKETGLFEKPEYFVSKGKPRPGSDKYAGLGISSDPVYAVYAEKKGVASKSERKPETFYAKTSLEKTELKRREQAVGQTMCCPHCGERLKKWMVPDNPFCRPGIMISCSSALMISVPITSEDGI